MVELDSSTPILQQEGRRFESQPGTFCITFPHACVGALQVLRLPPVHHKQNLFG